MANVFSRIKNIIVADLNEVLVQKEQKNPIGMLNQYLHECELETEKVRKLLERQYMLKNEFVRESHHAAELASKRKSQSAFAEQAGDAELAHFADQEHQQYAQRAVRLSEALKQANQQLIELETKYEEMKHKLKDMNIRRLELMGRENVSRAHQRMRRVMDQNSFTNESFNRFNEIDTYFDQVENQVNRAYYSNTIDARIAQLEKSMKKEETFSAS